MPKRKPLTASIAQVQEDTSEVRTATLPQPSLHDEVRQSLLNIIRDEGANAAAKASAARTLLEYFADSKPHASSNARGVELTASELDAMIAQLSD